MAESGPFQSLAEFAIALAGFTSIVVIFGRRGGEFHPVDRFRILSALVPSLYCAFLALVPVGLDLAGFSASSVWRASSLALVAVVGLESILTEVRRSRLPPESLTVLSSRLKNGFRLLRLLAILSGVLNGTGVLFAPQAGVYFLAVVCPLVIGAMSFVRTVFVRPAV